MRSTCQAACGSPSSAEAPLEPLHRRDPRAPAQDREPRPGDDDPLRDEPGAREAPPDGIPAKGHTAPPAARKHRKHAGRAM